MVTLEGGDLLLLYTDGVTETMAPAERSGSRAMFDVERLDQLLLSCRDCPPTECIERIRKSLAAYSESRPPADDRTLIAIRCV